MHSTPRTRMRAKAKSSFFGTSYDNVLFIILFILYLVGLFKTVHGEDVEGSGVENTSPEPDLQAGTVTTADVQTEPAAATTTTTTPTMTPMDRNKQVNIDVIYENSYVLKWVHAAIAYLKTVLTEVRINLVETFPATKTYDAIGLVTKLCRHFDAVNMNWKTKPDLVLDLTHTGIPSEAVKVITRTLKIPTISTSVGRKSDVREWSRLTPEQAEYLVRIPPPSSLVGYVVRSIVEFQSLATAAVFADEEYFEFTYEPRVVLRDLPVQHHFSKFGEPEQLMRLLRKDAENGFKNFFFIASSRKMVDIMDAIDMVADANKYSWFGITTDGGRTPRCGSCGQNFTMIYLKYHDPAERTKKHPELNDMLKREELDNWDSVENQFYINLVIDAVTGVAMEHFLSKPNVVHKFRKQKVDGTWNSAQLGRIPCVNYNLRGNYSDIEANLHSQFISTSGNLHGSYSAIERGWLHPDFYLKIEEIPAADFETKYIGTWRSGSGGMELITTASKSLLKYVPQVVYHVGTIVHPPFVYRKPNCDPYEVRKGKGNEFAHCYYGYSIDLIDEFKRELGFEYEIVIRETFGYLNNTSEDDWNGVMRDMLEKKVQIGIGPLAYMPERDKIVDFTRPYYPMMVGFGFVMPKPIPDESMFKFLTILETEVWWCILGAYGFTSILLFLFDRYGPSSAQNNKEEMEEESDEPPRVFTFRECFWFCFTSMTPQGGGEAPRGLSGRLVAATWWLFSFIIIASYTANMAAFLTVSGLVKPISSFDDLIAQQAVLFAPVDVSPAWIYFDRMAYVEQVFYERWRDMSLDDSLSEYNRSHLAVWTYPISDKFTKFWQIMLDNKPPQTFEEAVERLASGSGKKPSARRFALIAEETDLNYLTMTNCDLKMVGKPFGERSYAIAVTKGSPLKDMFNRVMDKLERERVLERIYDKWWYNNPFDKKCKEEDTTRAISFGNLSGVWVASGAGLIMALLTMIIEWAAESTKIWFEGNDIKGTAKNLWRRQKKA